MSTPRTERETEPRGRRGAANFIGHWQVWLIAIPAVGTGCFLVGGGWRWHITSHIVMPFGLFDEAARAEIIWLAATLSTALAFFVIGAGLFARKRVPLVVAHLAGSTWVAGLLVTVTTVVGWPLWWVIAHAAVSATIAVSWNYWRSDVLRGDAKEKDGSEDSWSKLLGTRAKVGAVEVGEHAISAKVTPAPGETWSDVEKALERIETAHPDAIPGRARIERSPEGKGGKVVLMHTDPLRKWPRWPGPSSPGGSFADGCRVGLYEDGQPEVFWQTAGLTAEGDPRPAGHVGTMGMTRSGKSGCAAVRWTDSIFTRRDVLLAYIDCAKPEQSMAGQVMDDLVLYASTPAQVKAAFRALMALTKSRAARMGRHGFRDWAPEVYDKLGIPALVVAIDEADKVINTKAFTDLATTCLSTGIYLDVLLPRADNESMPTTARFSFGQWLCFGTGDGYSHTFALSDQTVAAGADPSIWGNTRPGYHYLDRAPGVDERRYPMVARSFRADFGELAAAARAGRAYRAQLPDEDITALGSAWADCQPQRSAEPGPGLDEHDDTQMGTWEDEEMTEDDYSDDERIPPPTMRDAEPGDSAEYAATDPREEIQPHAGPDDSFDDPTDGRPKPPSRDAAREAFDLTLRQMARDGVEVFTNADVIDRYPYKLAESTMSERMSQVCEGDYVQPPGLSIERLGRGRYRLVREPASVLVGDVV